MRVQWRPLLVGLTMIVISSTSVRAQDDPCSTTPVGPDGVFLMTVSDVCQASSYPRAEDVPAIVATTGQAPDGYVLAAELVRESDGAGLLVLAKPWSLNTYILGLTLARLFEDGLVYGDGWHQVVPTSRKPENAGGCGQTWGKYFPQVLQGG